MTKYEIMKPINKFRMLYLPVVIPTVLVVIILFPFYWVFNTVEHFLTDNIEYYKWWLMWKCGLVDSKGKPIKQNQ